MLSSELGSELPSRKWTHVPDTKQFETFSIVNLHSAGWKSSDRLFLTVKYGAGF